MVPNSGAAGSSFRTYEAQQTAGVKRERVLATRTLAQSPIKSTVYTMQSFIHCSET